MMRGKPVVIVPGFNGSLLVKKEKGQINFFSKSSRTRLTNDVINYKLLWKMTSNQLINPDGFMAYDFGGIEGICDVVPQLKTLDNNFKKLFNLDKNIIDHHVNYSYFQTLAGTLMNKYFYEPKKHLIGLPYDYRYIGNHVNRLNYYRDIKNIIESTTHTNQSSVVVLAHSLGGMLFHDFLVSHVSNEWKQKHISEFITANTPFGGVPQSLFVMFDKSNIIHNTYRHFDGLHLCFPNDIGFSVEEPLVTITNEGKSADQVFTLQEIDTDILMNYDKAHKYELHKFQANLKTTTNVKTTHVVSESSSCEEASKNDALLYLTCTSNNKGNTDSYVYEKMTGDGLVPYRCMAPLDVEPDNHDVSVLRIRDSTHTNILKHPKFLQFVIETLDCQSQCD